MRDRARTALARFSYANVMSTLAVFLVLTGGAAYAANTIRSEDIVNGQVKAADLGANAVQSPKIATGAVTSSDVLDDDVVGGGLTTDDIANLTITAEDLAVGSVGSLELAVGAVASKAYTRSANTAIDTLTSKEVLVDCDSATDRVTGGGFVIAGPSGVNVPGVVVARSYAVDSNTWLVRAVAQSGAPSWQLSVIANCLR